MLKLRGDATEPFWLQKSYTNKSWQITIKYLIVVMN